MLKTSDYSMFKKHESNVPLDAGNLKKVMASIQARNLLQFRPILVNSMMQVIDGQHRLEAAKILGLEIYYSISPDANHEDILLLNINQRLWGPSHYLNYYISLGKTDYIKFQEFMKKYNLDMRSARTFLTASGVGSKVLFKRGLFTFPQGNEYLTVVELKDKFDSIIELITTQKIGGDQICTKVSFKQALLEMLKCEDVDLNVLKRKLSINLDKIRICSGASGYVEMLKQIYNWKNPNPLT